MEKDLDKFKLLFNYDPSKTLNENINETKTMEVDEQITKIAGEELGALKSAFEDAFKSSKDALSVEIKSADGAVMGARNADEILSALKDGRITPKTLGQVNTGLLKSATTPENVINSIIHNPKFDQAFLKKYGQYVNDEQALMAQLKQKYPEEVAQKMIDRVKGNGAKIGKEVEAGASKTSSSVEVKGPNGELIKTQGEATTVIQQTNINNATYATATETNKAVQASKEVVPEAKVVATEAEQVVKEMGPTKWEKFKKVARRLKPKYLIMLGLAGLTGWLLYKFFSSDSPKPKKDLFPSCLDDVIDDNGTTIQVTKSGDPVVKVTKTGNADYDSRGGLLFFNNNRVFLGNQKRRGSWSCAGGGVELSEQGDGNKSTGVGGITIKWDGDSKPVTPIKTGDDNQKIKSPKYHDCSNKDFPLEFGCISPKVAEVQGCLGVTPQKGYFGPKTLKALTDYSYDTKDGLTKEMYDKIIAACHAPTVTGSTTGDTTTITGTTTGSTATITGTTTTSPNAPITPPETPENAQFSIKRLKELLASKNLKKMRKGTIVKWKGPELGGDDYFILNKYLTDNGYIQKTQRETGDRDDEDITMKYKWKKEEPTTEV